MIQSPQNRLIQIPGIGVQVNAAVVAVASSPTGLLDESGASVFDEAGVEILLEDGT